MAKMYRQFPNAVVHGSLACREVLILVTTMIQFLVCRLNLTSSTSGIRAVEAAVDEALQATPIGHVLLHGTDDIWPIDVSGSLPGKFACDASREP